MAKVMISIPDDVLEQVDREATRRAMTRSALFREAAMHEVGRPNRMKFDAALSRSRARFVQAGGKWDAAALIRADRDARDSRDRNHL